MLSNNKKGEIVDTVWPGCYFDVDTDLSLYQILIKLRLITDQGLSGGREKSKYGNLARGVGEGLVARSLDQEGFRV